MPLQVADFLCLLLVILGVIVSLVGGQRPSRLAIGADDVTPGSTIPFINVGSGGNIGPALACFISSTASAQWLFPDGNVVPSGVGVAVDHTIHSVVQLQTGAITLHRGQGYFSPTGLYCCGQASATSNSQRLCITLAGLMIGTINLTPGSSIPITNVGSGGTGGLGDAGLTCDTSDASTAVWLSPGGSAVQLGTSSPAADNTIHYSRQSTTITLHRGDGYISPGGQYCCGSPTVATDRLCITLASCLLLSLANGIVTYTDPDINSIIATHICDNGYGLSGGPTRTCGIFGGATWDGEVVLCRAICADLSPPMNGAITYSSTSPRLQGATATYNCVTGHELSGGTMRTCQSDRTWSGGEISCQPVDCHQPPVINSGSRTFTTTTYLSIATYSCDSGYQMSGSPTVTCSSTGDWSATPTCIATCDDLSPPINGVITYSPTSSPRLEGTMAVHSCGTGYELSDSTVRTCQSDGTWSGGEISCTVVLPTSLAIGSSGNIQGSSVPISDVGRGGGGSPALACFIMDPFTIAAEWYFPDGSVVPLGTGTAGPNELIAVRQSAAITLHGDDVFSPTGLYCCGSPAVPESQRLCITLLAVCPSLTLPTNGMSITYNPPGSPTSQGTVATYRCITGYTPNPSTRTCQSDGTWNGEETTCVVGCGPPPSIANGSPGTPDRTTFGGTVTYTCEDGLTLSGQAMITCTANGMWSTPPSCLADCIPLSAPDNGQVTTTGTTYRDTATYSCNEGYNLIGSRTLTCGSDGMWTPAAPSCSPVPCGQPPSIANGSPGTPTSTAFEGAVAYSCNTGYIIIGSITITCLSTGSWSSPPVCQPLPPVYLTLSDANYISGISEIPLSSVGEGANSLSCRTDDVNCCRVEDAGVVKGAWHYPNGSVVSSDSGDLYTTREGPMVVNLNRRDGVDGPTGLYCCEVPTSTGTGVFCANLSGPALGSPSTQYDNTGAIVGGVVAIVLIIAFSITAVLIAYIVLRQRRTGGVNLKRGQPNIPLTDKGQSAPPQTYETVDTTCTYEEIDGTRPLKGNYDYTQNQAYAATTAPLRGEGVVNTGGSGNLTGDSQVGRDEEKIYEN